MTKRLLAVLLVALVSPGIAAAVPITFQFEGVVTQVVDPASFDGSILPGTPFSGSYSFDSEAAPVYSIPGLLARYPATGFHVAVGNYEIRYLQTNPEVVVEIFDSPDSYGVGSRNNEVTGVFPGVPTELVSPLVRVNLDLTDADVFLDTSLPLTPPDLATWPVNLFEIVADNGRVEPAFTITGQVTSIVPEPASGLLVGAGLLALAALPRVLGGAQTIPSPWTFRFAAGVPRGCRVCNEECPSAGR